LEANKDGEIDVLTSVLTIAECTHAEGNSEPKIRELFTRLLMSGQYVQLIQPTPFIAADARDLRWKHGLTLRGADGLHVASALELKATEFLTTDDKILKCATAVAHLGTKISTPAKTACLPLKYRQEEIFDDKVTILRPVGGSAKPA
jgi:predicted nucleic acid-binding protein